MAILAACRRINTVFGLNYVEPRDMVRAFIGPYKKQLGTKPRILSLVNYALNSGALPWEHGRAGFVPNIRVYQFKYIRQRDRRNTMFIS